MKKWIKNLVLGTFIVAFLTSCGGSLDGDFHKSKTVSFTKLAYVVEHRASSNSKEKFEVIRTKAKFDEIYLKYKDYQYFPKPSIDFNNELILYLNMGGFNSGGFDIKVSKITRYNNTIKVYVKTTQSSTGCFVTDAITEPRLFIKMSNKNSQNIEFIKTHEVIKCAM